MAMNICEALQSVHAESIKAPLPSSSYQQPRKSGRFAVEDDDDRSGREPPLAGTRLSAPVIDLCKTLHEMEAIRDCTPHECVSYLVDDNTETHRYELFIPKDPISPAFDTCSLEELFNARLPSYNRAMHRRGVLSHGDRLFIAAALASNVLQLDDSWMKQQFRSRDILVARPEVGLAARSNRVQPYLSRRVCVMNNIVAGAEALSSMRLQERTIRSTVLCALGLVLTELCFGQTLEDLRRPEDQVQGNELLTNLNTAKRVQKDILYEYGDRYENVVRRCLDCPFDVDEWSFENEDFQMQVSKKIVWPLLEDWRSFNGLLGNA